MIAIAGYSIVVVSESTRFRVELATFFILGHDKVISPMNIRNSDLLETVNDWSSFIHALEGKPTKVKGDVFEELGKYFLQNDPIYVTQLEKVWLFHEVPLEVKEYLNLPTRDQGIDIIAKTHMGDYWAVQCKYREDPAQNLTWQEISTFTGLTFGICRNITFGLILTTGERYPKLLTHQTNIGFCTNEVWNGLDENFFKGFRSLSAGIRKRESPFTPRPHQEAAIAKANEYFDAPENVRGKLIMPCGTGKSLTAFWIAEKLDARTILVAVPSLSLLRQTLKIWAREFYSQSASYSDYAWLCICSDASAGALSSDDVVTLTQDLGVPCYTDESNIISWFNVNQHVATKVVFTTYQSGAVTAKSCKAANIVFDLGIMDEAHKTTGRADGLFAHLLYDKNITIKKRIFMTATERRYKGSSDQLVSMDNVDLYGDCFYLLTFKEALAEVPKIVADYRILTLVISKSEVAQLVEENNFVRPTSGTWNEEVEAEMLAALTVLRKAMQKYPIRHAVSFHSSIARARVFRENADIFSEQLPQYGPLATYHVAGSDPSSTRERILDAFGRSNHALITNARCLTEGIDLPIIDCVLFADPKKSSIDIVQALGRALRPSANKEFGYIVVPVIYDEDSTLENLWDSDAFSDLVATIRALASNDERIIDYFRAVANGRSTHGLRVQEHILVSNIANKISINEFIDAIDLRCWESIAKLSFSNFKAARSFARRLGLHNAWEWQQYCEDRLFRKPVRSRGIPESPAEIYSKEWKGWADWLGLHSAGGTYLKFEYAREYVQRLELGTKAGWEAFVNNKLYYFSRPDYIHPNPDIIYYDEWQGWEDWLGQRKYWPFETAKSYAIELKLSDEQRWYEHWQNNEPLSLKPEKIPLHPEFIYEKQWKGWADWLGADRIMPYHEALNYAHSLGLKSRRQWSEYWLDKSNLHARPLGLPLNPKAVYKGEWINWGKWLGVEKEIPKPNGRYASFEDARNFVRTLGLSSPKDWHSYCAGTVPNLRPKPTSIPHYPQKVYKDEWSGWRHWLKGGNRVSSDERAVVSGYSPFEEARLTVRSLKFKSYKEWLLYTQGQLVGRSNRPVNIPMNPAEVYKDSWKGYEDWLGTNA